jgi:hypothetical protein
MWCYIDHVGCTILTHFMEKAYRGNRHDGSSKTEDGFVEVHKRLYREYIQKTALELGKDIWNQGKTEAKTVSLLRSIWKRRTKRCVTRFLIGLLRMNAHHARDLPSAMTAWMFGPAPLSMYPSDGAKPQGRTGMSDWEKQNCPWYLEYDNWNVFRDGYERVASETLRDGQVPTSWYDIGLLGDHTNDKVFEKCKKAAQEVEEIFPTTDPVYDGKKARKDVEEIKGTPLPADRDTQSQSTAHSGKIFQLFPIPFLRQVEAISAESAEMAWVGVQAISAESAEMAWGPQTVLIIVGYY